MHTYFPNVLSVTQHTSLDLTFIYYRYKITPLKSIASPCFMITYLIKHVSSGINTLCLP